MASLGLKLVGGAIAVLLVPSLSTTAQTSKDDEKLAKQIARLDAEFVKAVTDLAKMYDRGQVPEAAHFFASCAIGFGAKDEALASMKNSYEASVYLGKIRGGEPLKETAPITSVLGSLSVAYKKIIDPWILRARKGGLTEATRNLMLEMGVKYELARGAHEYIQATQRFNLLRKAMKLRAILWDFDESRKLVLATWYACETEDCQFKEPKRESQFFQQHLQDTPFGGGGPHKLAELPEALRSFALIREHLLNPNARTLSLGFWTGGSHIDYFSLYAIPQAAYRADIPTPTQRFRGETVSREWIDVEDTIDIDGKKVPFVTYPFLNEPDAPTVYSNGKGASEMGWAKSEHDYRDHGGLPIMVRFFIDATPTDVEFVLTDRLNQKRSCRIYLNGDKRVALGGGWATILALPDRPLDGLDEYSILVNCKIGSALFEKRWSFKTRAK